MDNGVELPSNTWKGRNVLIIGEKGHAESLGTKLERKGSRVITVFLENKSSFSSDRNTKNTESLTFSLGSYDSLIHAFHEAQATFKKSHQSEAEDVVRGNTGIDTVISYFPEHVPSSYETSTDQAPLDPLLKLNIWITKLTAFYVRWNSIPAGRERARDLILVAPGLAKARDGDEADPVEGAAVGGMIGLVRSLRIQSTLDGYKISLLLVRSEEGKVLPAEHIDVVIEAASRAIDQPLQEGIKPAQLMTRADIFQVTEHGVTASVPPERSFDTAESYKRLNSRVEGGLKLGTAIRNQIISTTQTADAFGVSLPHLLAIILGIALTAYLWFWLRGYYGLPKFVYAGLGYWGYRLVAGERGKKSGLGLGKGKGKGGEGKKRGREEKTNLAVFLGSGGHTSEALQLLNALDLQNKFTHRTYIYGTGDVMSVTKAIEFERSLSAQQHQQQARQRPEAKHSCPSNIATYSALNEEDEDRYELAELPRARRVGQGSVSSVWTTACSVLAGVGILAVKPAWENMIGRAGGGGGGRLGGKGKRRKKVEVLLLNGPGTSVVVFIAYKLRKFLGIADVKTIYIESFARVTSLSLSGKILKRFVDRFETQWDMGLIKAQAQAQARAAEEKEMEQVGNGNGNGNGNGIGEGSKAAGVKDGKRKGRRSFSEEVTRKWLV